MIGLGNYHQHVRDAMRRVARRSYALTKWRLLRRTARLRGAPVVVFSMSKTASTAIFLAVQQAVPRPVFKIHLLVPEHVARAEAEYRRTDRAARPRHIFHASHLMHRSPTPDGPWSVVTVIREPLMRSASDFFQSGTRMGRLHDESTTKHLFEQFAIDEGIPRTVDWFDRELLPSLEIDVYAHPFDPSLGYGVIETPSVRLLVLRQESLAVAPRALSQFLGLTGDLEIVRENVGAGKEYSDLYASVLRDVRFSDAALDLAYDSRYARHFYSAEETEAFRRRWSQSDRGTAGAG